MEHSLKYSWSLRRTPDGPLAPYIDGFKGRLCTLGYAETSAHLLAKTTPHEARAGSYRPGDQLLAFLNGL